MLKSGECLMSDQYQEGDGERDNSLNHYKYSFFLDLTILFQSPEIVTVDGCDEVMLYCIPSAISREIDYNWHTPDSMVLPSTPVVYVAKPGVYFCTVSYDDQEILSEPTDVKVFPGMFFT